MLPAVLVAAAAGVAVLPRETRLLAACAAAVPLLALVVARSSGSPETRHLIFLLPFLALAVGAGLTRLGRVWAPLALAALVSAQIAWAWDRTPDLFEWEPDVRQEARADAAAYLAATTGPGDVLLGYDPLFLQAWERRSDFPLEVLPRADADLALHNLLDARPPARPRRLGLRREQDDELRALDGDCAHLAPAGFGLRGARLRPVPDHPHARSRS